ncbi:hypothetical protein Bca4012_083691 [Brassica carinata]
MNPTDRTTNPSNSGLPIQSDSSPDQTTTGVSNPISSSETHSGLPTPDIPQHHPAPNRMEAQLSEMRQMMMQLVDKAQVNERTVQQLADRQQRFEEVTRSLTATTRPPPRQNPGVTFRDRLADPSFPRGRLDFSPDSTIPGEQGPVFQTPRARTSPAFNPPITGAMGSNVASTSSVPDQATDRSTRLPPPPPIFRSGEGTSIPSGGRTSASGYQTRNFTPNPDEHQRTDANPTVHPTDPAHQNNPRANERLSPPAAWENDRTRFRQEPAHQPTNRGPF